MATYKAVVLKGKNQVKSDGTGNIKIRIFHKGKHDYLATTLYTTVDHFDNKTGFATSGKNMGYLNLQIIKLLEEYIQKDLSLGSQKNFMSAKDIKQFMINGKTAANEIDFFEFIDNFCKKVTVKGTRDQYEDIKRSLQKFAGLSLPVSEISLNFLLRYERYLYNNDVKNGVINKMSTFRSLFNKCKKHYNNENSGRILIPHYPFGSYEMPKRVSKSKKHVTPLDELQKFMNFETNNPDKIFTRDMYMLMIYLIGIEAKDLFYLRPAVNGRVEYDRFKTGGVFSIKLEPEALAIIEKYKGTDYLLNINTRFKHHKSFYRLMNDSLKGRPAYKNKPEVKGIFPQLGITKPVTTKWARHTWATFARNRCEINKDDVALCLGHKDIDNRVTDMYVEEDYTIIDKSNRKVIDYIHTRF